MALLIPNVGEVWMLDVILDNRTQRDFTLKLYTNAVTPAEGDTAATYTECVSAGYSAITLTHGSWTVATGGGTTSATYTGGAQSFTFTATATSIVGYFVIAVTDTTLLWAEEFANSEPVFSGKVIKITPYIELA